MADGFFGGARFQPAQSFAEAMRRYATGPCVISTDCGGLRAAATVRAAAPLSAALHGLILSLGAPPAAFKTLSRASHFCLNVLQPGQNAAAFAAELNDPICSYDGEWRDGPYDLPYVATARLNLFCTMVGWAVLERDALIVGAAFHAVVEERSTRLRFAGAVSA